MNAIQEAVNEYTRQGFSVIPCGPDKRPLVTWGEYQARKPAKEELQEWFGGDKPPRIGVVCGAASGGLAVADLDDLDVAQAVACDLELQATTTLVETPSGGCHVWLQAEGRCCPLKAADGTPIGDLKAEGGYVMAPPSPGYRFISRVAPLAVSDAYAWAGELLRGVGVTLADKQNGHKPAEPMGEVIPEGARNQTLTRLAGAMRRVGAGESAIFAALLAQNGACETRLPQAELAAIAKSISRYAPEPPAAAPYKEQQQTALSLVTLAQLRERYSGEVVWVVPGYLARGELVILAGAGESLKSWQAAHLAAAIDGRFKWLGALDVAADRVAYLEQERGGNLLYQLNRIETGERITLGSDRLVILPPTALPLSEPATVAALEGVIATFRPDVVIINALRDVLGRANENSPTDMAALLRPLGQLAERYSLCLLLLDHFNKSGALGVVRGAAAHGGTAQKYNEADCVLIAERPRDELGHGIGPATVSTSKRRQGQEGSAFAVSVTDSPDGGVLVRAEVGVIALSPLAQTLKGFLGDGPSTVAVLSERSKRAESYVREALSELRAAGLVEGKPTPGERCHTYSVRGP